MSSRAGSARLGAAALAGGLLVALVRLLTVPRSLWEYDEHLFAMAVRKFEPLLHHPHPPGYPLAVGLGKLFDLAFHDPFRSLVAVSVLSSLVGYPALVAAFRRLLGEGAAAERTAVLAALLFHLSPVMLVQATLALSDPPALMFISLALWGVALVLDGAGTGAALLLGAASSAAVGCRPQLAPAMLAMLLVVGWEVRRWRPLAIVLAAFAVVSLAWLLPLVAATGGWDGFLRYELRQAAEVAARDAGVSRGHRSALSIALHFIANPWGPRAIALPLLVVAGVGIARLLRERRRESLPMLVFSALHLVACLLTMDPADGSRYALPALPAMALGFVVGAQALAQRWRRPALGWTAVVAVILISAGYAWPVLAARASGPAPPARAANWLHANAPANTTVRVSAELAAHAADQLADLEVLSIGQDPHCGQHRRDSAIYSLAEGESRDPHALVFRWPDSQAFRRLTRNHYRVVSLVREGYARCRERHRERTTSDPAARPPQPGT